MSNLNYFLWLTAHKGFRPLESWALLQYFGSPERIYFASEREYDLLSLSPSKKSSLLDKDLSDAERIQEQCARENIRIITIQDASYPDRLRQIDDPPCVLYLKGRSLPIDQTITVGLVGTRTCTTYGIHLAEQLGYDLARSDALLVSGIARGIDAAGIRGALRGGGGVISVLGGGIDVPYPAENRELHNEVAAAGMLISEYPPGTANQGFHFPIRNRIISGLSLGVTVVEAGEPSGALITARLALEQNREVFACPGPVNSAASMGCNRLIQRGEAKLILTATDILEEFPFFLPHPMQHFQLAQPVETAEERLEQRQNTARIFRRRPAAASPSPHKETEKEVDKERPRAYISLSEGRETFTDDERAVMFALSDQTLTADETVEAAQLPTRRVLSALTLLQVRSLVEECPGKRFRARIILKP